MAWENTGKRGSLGGVSLGSLPRRSTRTQHEHDLSRTLTNQVNVFQKAFGPANMET